MRVYDNSPATDSTSAAYQHSQLIHIMELPKPSSIVIHSVVASGAITLSCLFYQCLLFAVYIDTSNPVMSLPVHTTLHNSVSPTMPASSTCMHVIIL